MAISKRKMDERSSRIALLILERKDVKQEDVADLFRLSRTQLRRSLNRLADEFGEREPGLRERVKAVREKIVNSRHRRRSDSLSNDDVDTIKLIKKELPDISMVLIAKIFGVSRPAIYRALARDEENGASKISKFSRASLYIPAASQALQTLSIPNDLDESHRDLFLELVNTVEYCRRYILELETSNDELEDEVDRLNEIIRNSKPLWKKAFEVFIMKSSESAGSSIGKGSIFAAGFIAGTLYKAL